MKNFSLVFLIMALTQASFAELAPNQVQIVLDGHRGANRPTISITVCEPGKTPGSNACKVVGDVLVDTGSSGLRIWGSALKGIQLPFAQGENKNLYECYSYAEGNPYWGGIHRADIYFNDKMVSHDLNLQVYENPELAPTASFAEGGCPHPVASAGSSEDIGVMGMDVSGLDECTQDGATDARCQLKRAIMHYLCDGKSCTKTAMNEASFAPTSPVFSLSPGYNNGFAIELPHVDHPTAVVKGVLTFGFKTQANNEPGEDALEITPIKLSRATATFDGKKDILTLIDSGFEGNGLPMPNLNICKGPWSKVIMGILCPTEAISETVLVGSLQVPAEVNIAAAADGQAASSLQVGVVPNLGTVMHGDPLIILGLPFFLGKKLYFSSYSMQGTAKVPTSIFVEQK